MNKFFKCAAITVALMTSVAVTQAFAETAASVEVASKSTTGMYNALANSTDPKATIAALVAAGADVDTVISIATVAGVPLASIEAALPNVTVAQVQSSVAAALANPAAFAPATAAGPAQAAGAATSPGAPSTSGGSSGGTSGSGFSGGGGGGGAGAASGS